MLERFGIAHERFAGVDGRHLTAQMRARVARPAQHDHALTDGEIGCFLSHRGVWEKIASGEDVAGLILEDDVCVLPELADLMSGADWLPADAAIVILETRMKRLITGSRATAAPAGRRTARLLSPTIGAAAYIVTRTAARHLLAITETFAEPVDELLFNRKNRDTAGMAVYVIDPAIAIQVKLIPQAELSQPFRSLLREERRQARTRSLLPKIARQLRLQAIGSLKLLNGIIATIDPNRRWQPVAVDFAAFRRALDAVSGQIAQDKAQD
mgnify:CR=1 FL=1